MRFGFVCPRFHHIPSGGIDSSTVQYAKALCDAGHEVHAITTKVAQSGSEVWNEIRVHHCPLTHLRGFSRFFPGVYESFQLARALLGLHREHRFDLIEIPNWEGIGAFAAAMQLPVAVRHHTSTIDSQSAQDARISWQLRCLAILENASGFWARANIVHSTYHASKVRTLLGHASLVRIPHVIPGSCQRVSPATGARPFVLSVGTLMPRKGSLTLMKVATEFLQALPDWELRLAGIDPEGSHQSYVAQNCPDSVAQRIIFEGYVNDSRLSDLYDNCEIYVTTSLFESFGLTLLEAMKRGKPVVATNAGALPELVVNAQSGFLFEPSDAHVASAKIVELARNPQLRTTMGDQAVRIAREYSDMDALRRNYECLAMSLKVEE
jgi:glycosyltransferase involved in cell wall biosynthesis